MIGEIIKLRAGSITDLARKMGITREHVHRLIRDGRLEDIAKALKTTPAELQRAAEELETLRTGRNS